MRLLFNTPQIQLKSLLAITALSLLSISLPSSLLAIGLDSFEGTQSVSSFGSSNVTDSSNRVTEGAIGGRRSMSTTATGGNPALTITATTTAGSNPVLDHSQTGDITGITVVHYDGDSDATTIDYDGLQGIDLSEDSGTAFVLKEVFFDFPGNQPATVTIRAYDASDPAGDTYSDYSIELTRAYNFEDITLMFSAPTSTGPSGGVDITNVGAIVLTIDGSSPAVDMLIPSFSTNGPCPLTPGVGGRVLDDCGECIPPSDPSYNQSCIDCLGVPNGTTLPGDTCDTGELGPCAGGIYNTACDCERVNDPTVEICDGADNNCNGEIDETFPQVGGPCGISEDDCEVTGEFICDDIGGVICDIDFSTANLDDCDIDIGCDGIPGSGTIPDECGICEGDGSTCDEFECNSTDISNLLFQLDGGAKEQEQLIRRITRAIRKNSARRRRAQTNAYIKEVRVEAHELQVANWILSWTLPRISVECSSLLASNFCVLNDNTPTIDEYVGRSEELRDLGLETTKRLRRASGRKRIAKRWRNRVNNQHSINLGIAEQVPETQAVCTSISDE